MKPFLETASADLRALEQLVCGETSPDDRTAIESARERAGELAGALQGSEDAGFLAVTFAADLLGQLWLESRWTAERIDAIVHGIAEHAALAPDPARMSLFLHVTRDQRLFDLPPKLAIEAQLQMLIAFGPVTEASLWVAGSTSEKVSCALCVGAGEPGRRARAAAGETMAKNRVTTSGRALIHAAPLRRWGRPQGALVGKSGSEGRRDAALAYLNEAALAVGPFLELQTLLERNAAHERSLVESSERRLARLGFDLHDGPMQDIAALGQDLRFFKSQLAPYIERAPEARPLIGRIDDLEARLVALDRDLRDLARPLNTPALSRLPLSGALQHAIGEFERRTGVQVHLSESGDFSETTASQRIALVRVVQEALNNVHEHSGAGEARVTVTAGRSGLTAEVYDEGQGFEVEDRLVQAARGGRLGLVGMSERIRLLGGKLEIETRTGGPTRILVRIPRWQPLTSS